MYGVRSGLRLDPNNKQLNALMDKIRPLRERAEKQRVSGLDRTERMKEEGDNAFKSAHFEKAIESYSSCIQALRDDVSSSSCNSMCCIFVVAEISLLFFY